jgi:aryl-alcohol dehydrogenase-like predicted oxidoreductase
VTESKDVAAALGLEQGQSLAGRTRRLGKRTPGRATPEGTRRYAERFKDRGHAELGKTGLMASRFGFGCYRVDDETPLFAEALRVALQSGVNLIDTSTNYTNGASERLVGSLVAELPRDEIIVVSKIGYVQGPNLELARERMRAGKPFPEMVEYADGCWHCIHPEFLADQLERSLDRLGLEHLDVCLLHNPEYFLSHANESGGVTDAVRDVFYERLGRALAYLEEQRKAGRIGAYGISSNTVAEAPSMPEATQLDRMLAAHRFQVLQLPFNLIESAPARTPLIGDKTVLEHAAAEGVAVLGNRPLNAIRGDEMLRLADAPSLPAPPRSYTEQLARLRQLEQRFAGEMGSALERNPFTLADELARLDGRVGTLDQFEQLARGQVLPHVGRAIGMVERALGSSREGWQAWRTAYIQELEHTLAALRTQTLGRAAERARQISERIDPMIPLSRHKESLQRKALWALTSTPGLSSVLLGMRQPGYVKDAVAVMSWPRLDKWRAVLEAMV